MTDQEFESFVDRSLQDKRLSRGEKQALVQLAGEIQDDEQTLARFRRMAFDKAARAIDAADATVILEWLEDILKVLQPKVAHVTATPATTVTGMPTVEAYFSPGDECCRRIITLLNSAKRTIDICVFTITDDRITQSIVAAHHRGVRVRIVTDDDKSQDVGSDIQELRRNSIALRMDDSPYHMHHKFVIVDGCFLLNGSFNWTRSASLNNQENFIISNDARLVAAFMKEFERLWAGFKGN